MISSTTTSGSTKPRAYRARWIVPISRPPLEDGVVAIHGGKIIFAGERRSWSEPVTDLGEVAILPGLVNAHTHLEFSELPTPFGQRGEEFARWIPQVVAHRRARPSEQQQSSIRQGLNEATENGVALLGEISTTDQWPTGLAESIAGIAFHEFLGWDLAAIPALLAKARALLRSKSITPWRQGLSPHAPYTVHRELLAGLCDLAAEQGAPVAMHLAESPAELEFLATGQGPLRTMLEAAGVWKADFWQQPLPVQDILQQLAKADRALVIHGNQLQTRDWDYLAERRERMSVVYCPRTRDFFFPEQRYPLEQMLARGVAVAIGTDSRASNPDLSLWRELQFVAQHHQLAPAEILRLGTEHGAQALGFASSQGRLEVGYSGTLGVVQNSRFNGNAEQLAENLLASGTVVRGLA